ncbi:MAG: hypothetical protein HKM04_07785 [Legionellales bacterium]|nr:hypothetical protein [Legionellales bacterium]
MSNFGVTYEEIVNVAERVLQEGETPTIERIRIKLGRGSNTTISKYLGQWKQLRFKATDLNLAFIHNPPDPVNQAVAKVWQQLQEENQTKLEALESKTAERIQAVLEEKTQLLKESQQLMADNQDLRRLLQETRGQNASLEKQLVNLNQGLAVIESKWKGAEEAKLSFHEYANKTLASIEEKHQQVLANYEVQLKQTKQFCVHELSQMKEIAESQRHQHIVEIDHLKTANQKLQMQLTEKNKALIEVISKVGQLTAQLKRQEEDNADILTTLSQNEQHTSRLIEALSTGLHNSIKKENEQQTEKFISVLQKLVNEKENKKPAKGKAT